MGSPEQIDVGAEAFARRPELQSHIAYEAFVALARHPGKVAVIDRSLGRKAMHRGTLLAASCVLAKRIASWTDAPRVGIVFPPGLGAFLTNLAVVLAGRIPVNLNFTLGPTASKACMRTAGIDCILTAGAVQSRLPDFPWPETGVIDCVEEMKSMPKLKVLLMLAGLRLLPAPWMAALNRVPRHGGDQEAALLFTSGSSGEPKGVVLTHRNLIGNCLQIDSSGLLPSDNTVLGNLPVFHSFGFTVTLWYALLRGCKVVTLPSPLDVKRNAEVVAEEQVTVMVGTPTFFRPYFKRVEPEQLKSVRLVVGGAEKTPDGFHEAWQNRFGGIYLEGYGLTETAPVVAVNLVTQAEAEGAGGPFAGLRKGSVGRLLPGHAARILNPDTREPQPLGERGLLALKGPNIFAGYLDQPEKTEAVLGDGWFVTGDLARFDADGFLYIEGRLSRFSKIGGEMVPHGTVEEALVDALDIGESADPVLAIGARLDPAKGEALVLLTTLALTAVEVRERLHAHGIPNLWIPKVVKRVDAIPVLATGKLDLRGVSKIAAETD